MDTTVCVLRCLGWQQWQQFMFWRESEVERLPKCTSEAAEGGRRCANLSTFRQKKWVKQVSSRGGVNAVTFSALSHLVAAAQGQNVHCLLPLLCSKLLLLHLLNHTHRSEEIRSTYTPSPETTTQQTLRFLDRFTHSFPYLSLEGIVSHSHWVFFFYRHSIPLGFVLLPVFWLALFFLRWSLAWHREPESYLIRVPLQRSWRKQKKKREDESRRWKRRKKHIGWLSSRNKPPF